MGTRRSGPSIGVRTDDWMALRCAWPRRKKATRLCLGHETCGGGAGRGGSATSAGLSVSVTAISARWDRPRAIPTHLVPMERQVRRGVSSVPDLPDHRTPAFAFHHRPRGYGYYRLPLRSRSHARHRRSGAPIRVGIGTGRQGPGGTQVRDRARGTLPDSTG